MCACGSQVMPAAGTLDRCCARRAGCGVKRAMLHVQCARLHALRAAQRICSRTQSKETVLSHLVARRMCAHILQHGVPLAPRGVGRILSSMRTFEYHACVWRRSLRRCLKFRPQHAMALWLAQVAAQSFCEHGEQCEGGVIAEVGVQPRRRPGLAGSRAIIEELSDFVSIGSGLLTGAIGDLAGGQTRSGHSHQAAVIAPGCNADLFGDQVRGDVDQIRSNFTNIFDQHLGGAGQWSGDFHRLRARSTKLGVSSTIVGADSDRDNVGQTRNKLDALWGGSRVGPPTRGTRRPHRCTRRAQRWRPGRWELSGDPNKIGGSNRGFHNVNWLSLRSLGARAIFGQNLPGAHGTPRTREELAGHRFDNQWGAPGSLIICQATLQTFFGSTPPAP